MVIGLYAQARAAFLQSPLINPSLPQHLSFSRPSDKPFPHIELLPNYPFIERYSYPSPQNDPSLAVSDCQFSPALLPGVGQEGSRSQCDMDGDSRPFGIYCFCILFKPNGRLFYSRTSLLSPAIGDVPPHPISMSVTLGSTFRAGFVLFYYPHPLPLPYSPHLVRLWSVFSQVGALFTHRPSWT